MRHTQIRSIVTVLSLALLAGCATAIQAGRESVGQPDSISQMPPLASQPAEGEWVLTVHLKSGRELSGTVSSIDGQGFTLSSLDAHDQWHVQYSEIHQVQAQRGRTIRRLLFGPNPIGGAIIFGLILLLVVLCCRS